MIRYKHFSTNLKDTLSFKGIYIIGEGPSSKNLSPEVAFVGTKSFDRLIRILKLANIKISEVYMINLDRLPELIYLMSESPFDPFIICCGNKVDKGMRKLRVDWTVKVNHPSPRNLYWNSADSEKATAEFIKSRIPKNLLQS
jgi:hypothetical protein